MLGITEFKNQKPNRGILYRYTPVDDQDRYWLVLAPIFWKLALRCAHNDARYLRGEHRIHITYEQFDWPTMIVDIDDRIKSSVKWKTPANSWAPMVDIVIDQSYLYNMDMFILKLLKRSSQDCLVITDHAVAVPIRNQTAKVSSYVHNSIF